MYLLYTVSVILYLLTSAMKRPHEEDENGDVLEEPVTKQLHLDTEEDGNIVEVQVDQEELQLEETIPPQDDQPQTEIITTDG